MEEAEARHVEVVHYSATNGIRVGKEASCRREKGVGFWSIVLENFSGLKLKKEEADQAEKHVKGVTGWNDMVEEHMALLKLLVKTTRL